MAKKIKPTVNVFSILIAFLLSVFLSILCLLLGTYFGLFNKALLSDAMNKSAYYESVNSYTVEEVSDLLIPQGLDSSVLDNVFTLQTTYTEGKALLDANLNGQGYTVSTDNIQEKLRNNIIDYTSKHNLVMNSTISDNITYFSNQVCSIYVQNLTVPFLSYFAGIRKMLFQVMIIAIPVLTLLSVGCILLLIKLQNWLHRALRMIAYSFSATALMVSLLPCYLLITRTYTKINISPIYFHKLLTRYIGQSLMMYIYSSIVMLAIALFVIAAIYQIKKRLMH